MEEIFLMDFVSRDMFRFLGAALEARPKTLTERSVMHQVQYGEVSLKISGRGVFITITI